MHIIATTSKTDQNINKMATSCLNFMKYKCIPHEIEIYHIYIATIYGLYITYHVR